MGRLSVSLVLFVIVNALSQEQFPRPHAPGESVKYPDDYCKNIADNEQFDFIVVGSGPAGSVVARRLAEIPTNRVLLLEAGGDPPAMSDIPGNVAKLGLDLRWKFHTVADNVECLGYIKNTCKLNPGMVLGGSSVINYMMYVRGNPEDFNEWAEMGGGPGWNYQNVLPYFKKLENYLAYPVTQQPYGTVLPANTFSSPIGGVGYTSINISPLTLRIPTVSSAFHSVGGPFTGASLQLDPLTHKTRLGLFEAFRAYGIQENIDINSDYQIGASSIPGMVDALGYRYSAAKAYLLNIPDNLKVCKHALVTKVNIDPSTNPKVVTSVEFVHAPINVPLLPVGRTLRAVATKEYIISAGPLNSPGILERSGIGKPEILAAAGVEPILNLNVGENYQDQLANLGATFTIDFGSKTESNPLALELTSFTAFINISDPLSSVPDIQYILRTYEPAIGLGLSLKPDIQAQLDAPIALGLHQLTVGDIILRQTKPGSVHISQAADPKLSPKIVGNQFSEPRDVDLTVRSVRLIRQIMSHPALAPFKPVPFRLNECKMYPFNSEQEIMCMTRMIATSLYHQCGTCSMGATDDPTSVVDPELRVIGTRNLRVIDSSIMRLVTRGNTEVPTLMIGEKGADLVKAAWGQF